MYFLLFVFYTINIEASFRPNQHGAHDVTLTSRSAELVGPKHFKEDRNSFRLFGAPFETGKRERRNLRDPHDLERPYNPLHRSTIVIRPDHLFSINLLRRWGVAEKVSWWLFTGGKERREIKERERERERSLLRSKSTQPGIACGRGGLLSGSWTVPSTVAKP